MDPVEPPELPAGLTAGRLEGIPIPSLLVALCRAGKTGVLHVRAAFDAWVYLDRGRVVFAASDNPDRRIGALLLRQGAIQLTDLRAALERQRSGDERLGTLLVQAGSIGEDGLVDALRAQFRAIVVDLFELERGEYAFHDQVLPTDESVTLVDTIEDLIHAGIRTVGSFVRIRREVGGAGTLYALTDDWRERVAGLTPGGGEAQVIERLGRGEESVEYLCRELLLSSFEIYQALWSLAVLGAIRRIPPGGETLDDDAFCRPERYEGFAEFLLRLCRSGETGVLYASRGAVERTFHLRDGRCSFATSSDPDDGLVTNLLRRGVISLRDREEVARRMLSNKRVGTLLLELGVLDEDDLCDAVRRQLGEIIWSTVGWESGAYTFVGGSLPSLEEITLDLDIEALLNEGLRRVTSWSRVRSGAGGLRSQLALSPSYLDVLGAMGAGVEERDIAAALREPRSAVEICELLGLGDFRVCQVLWCLRVLGAVEVVERVEETSDDEVVAHRFDPRPVAVAIEELDRATEIPVEAVDEERPTRTQRIPAEEIAIALGELPARSAASHEEAHEEGVPFELDDSVLAQDAAAEPLAVEEHDVPVEALAKELSGDFDGDPWEPPADLDVAIARFNAAQRLVYRTVRVEIGAGAANLIRACCTREAEPGPIGGSTLHTDGSWDTDALREAAIACRLEEPWTEYQRLLDHELDRLRDVIGPDQTEALAHKIEQVD